MSVKSLQMLGLCPDILVCRTDRSIPASVRAKLALFCNVPPSNVLQNIDLESIYEAPLALEDQGIASVVLTALDLPSPEPNLTAWRDMIARLKNPTKRLGIAIVGKYVSLHDSYISVVEALRHSGMALQAKIELKWVDSETVTPASVESILGEVEGILVPGGFGDRGIEGMLTAINYARTKKKPLLGLCLGMQLVVIEFARNVLGLENANSSEFDPETPHPVIDFLPDQSGVRPIGGTLRRGSYPCVLDKTSKAFEIYGAELIEERHRHRYEVNNNYRERLVAGGLKLAGLSPDQRIVEIVELPAETHPFYIATQAHPEFKSRPTRAHPLFKEFVRNALVW
jgi:CTP synthase